MKATMGKKLIMGICMAGVAALCAIYCGCGEENCSISEMKSCSTSEDCVLVGCGCCYDSNNEAVRKECRDTWYRFQSCRPGAVICLAIVCYRSAACENNKCVVK